MNEKDQDSDSDKEFKRKQRKGMWIALVTSMLLFLFLGTYYFTQVADAQTEPKSFFESIDSPDSCERIRIFGERAWLPFRLVITHDPTDQILTHVSATDKKKESRDIVANEDKFDFLTEEINTWTIGYQFTYPLDDFDPSGESIERTYVIEYASEGKPTQKETRKMFGNSICHIFEITTEEAPEFPVVDDLLTDIGVQSLQEMQFVVPAINTLDQTLGRNTFVIVIFIVVVLVLIGYMYFKAKEFGETRLQTQRQILESTKNSNKQTELARKAVDHIYSDLIPSIESKMQNMIDKFELEKNRILLDIKSAVGANTLKPSERKGGREDINEESKVYTEDTDEAILLEEIEVNEESLKQFKEVEEKKEITFASLPDIENIQDAVKPKSLKQKITEPIKNRINVEINRATKLPEKLRKSQPIFMKSNNGKIQIDYALDQEVKPIKLKKLYSQNANKINETLYRKYWNLTKIYPNVSEIRKRCNILNDMLTNYAKSFEAKRQAESEIKSKNGDKKNGGA